MSESKLELTMLELENEIRVTKCRVALLSDVFSAMGDRPVGSADFSEFLSDDGSYGIIFFLSDIKNLLTKIDNAFSSQEKSAAY